MLAFDAQKASLFVGMHPRSFLVAVTCWDSVKAQSSLNFMGADPCRSPLHGFLESVQGVHLAAVRNDMDLVAETAKSKQSAF